MGKRRKRSDRVCRQFRCEAFNSDGTTRLIIVVNELNRQRIQVIHNFNGDDDLEPGDKDYAADWLGQWLPDKSHEARYVELWGPSPFWPPKRIKQSCQVGAL